MAVYTRFSDDELKEFLDNYQIDTVINVQEIEQGVENSNFFLTTNTQKYVLTIYEKRVSSDDLPYFFGFCEYLNTHGIKTPLAVKTKKGESYLDFVGKKAALIQFLSGHNLTVPSVIQCESAGDFVARMHLAQAGFSPIRLNTLSPSHSLWQLFDKIAPLLAIKLPDIYTLAVSEVAYLKQNYPLSLPLGTIHADIFPDNMFFHENKATAIIDFYFSCTDFLAYDLAIIICAWCFDEGVFNPEKYHALLNAYLNVRPLLPLEMQNLPVLMRGAAMRFMLTRSHDYIFQDKNALVQPKNPYEYEKTVAIFAKKRFKVVICFLK